MVQYKCVARRLIGVEIIAVRLGLDQLIHFCLMYLLLNTVAGIMVATVLVLDISGYL